jgi:hypothetical protein
MLGSGEIFGNAAVSRKTIRQEMAVAEENTMYGRKNGAYK